MAGETEMSDHLVPVESDHCISLILIHLRWSDYLGYGGQFDRFPQVPGLPDGDPDEGGFNKKSLDFVQGFFVVGVAGFEPATSCSQSRRDEPGYAIPRNYLLSCF